MGRPPVEELPLSQHGGLERPQTGQALVRKRSSQHRWGAGAWEGAGALEARTRGRGACSCWVGSAPL